LAVAVVAVVAVVALFLLFSYRRIIVWKNRPPGLNKKINLIFGVWFTQMHICTNDAKKVKNNIITMCAQVLKIYVLAVFEPMTAWCH
jgi:hypothetical protein